MFLNIFLQTYKHIKETRFKKLNLLLQKGIYPKSTANIIFDGKTLHVIPLKNKGKKRKRQNLTHVHYLLYYLTLNQAVHG